MNTTEKSRQQLAELERQQAEASAQTEALNAQIKAAVRREVDLKQQLDASQKELAKLGFMQLGRRMIVKAEQDNIRKKLTANQQLQESLLARQQACHEQQAALEAQIAQVQAERMAVPSEEAPAEEAPAAEAAVPAETPAPVEAEEHPVEASVTANPVPLPHSKAPSSRRSAQERKPAAPRKPRVPWLDATLPVEEQISQMKTRLTAFYPEGQVFALDSVCPDLHAKLNAIAGRSGCASAAELLQKMGFTLVSGVQGRVLRQGRYCTPGAEPEVIQPLLTSVLRRLEKHYPDRIIPRSIQSEHKSLAQDVSGLHQWLGYAGAAELLTAYGYEYRAASGGRPATDVQALLDTLRAAYTQGEKPRTIAKLVAEHPEFASALKTLQNQAPARFGMPLKQYLAEQGILAGKEVASPPREDA